MLQEFLDLKPRNPYLSLAMDEAMCRYFGSLEDFRGGLRLWSNHYSIVLGRTCKPEDNLKPQFLSSFDVTHTRSEWSRTTMLCRRASGGGTVLHGPGGLNYSIFLPLERRPDLFPVQKSYDVLIGVICQSLRRLGVEARMEGQSDIVVPMGERVQKISGNAQFRKHGILVHHGTLIVHRDLIEFISRYLDHPPAEPDYRGGRSHQDFLTSLPDDFDIAAFYNSLSAGLRRLLDARGSEPLSVSTRRSVFRLARKMAVEIYGRKEWILHGRKHAHV